MTITISRGNGTPVTRTDVVYLTSHLSGTVWVGYVPFKSLYSQYLLTRPPVKPRSRPSQIRQAPQPVGGLAAGLAKLRTEHRCCVMGTVIGGCSEAKDHLQFDNSTMASWRLRDPLLAITTSEALCLTVLVICCQTLCFISGSGAVRGRTVI